MKRYMCSHLACATIFLLSIFVSNFLANAKIVFNEELYPGSNFLGNHVSTGNYNVVDGEIEFEEEWM